MGGFDVTIEGLDELRQRFKQHRQLLEAELLPAVSEGSQLLRDEARSRAPGRKLPSSIRSEVARGHTSEGIVYSVAATARSIEEGRRPGNPPSLNLLTAWVRRNNIATGGVKPSRRTRTVKAQERAAAWNIAQAIRAKGTQPQPFFAPAIPAAASRIHGLFVAAVGRALKRIAT